MALHRTRSWTRIVAMACMVALASGGCHCDRTRPLRVGTYNIRRFGVEATDLDRLATVIRDTHADVLALQEIMDDHGLATLEERLAAGSNGRRYTHVVALCGGRSGMRVGFLYDPSRVRWVSVREYPALEPGGDGSCTDGDRAGLLGTFVAGDRTVRLLAVHLAAGGSTERAATRRAQWTRALVIVGELRREAPGPVALLGDANSTGWLDNTHGERDFIEAEAQRAGLEVITRPLACSEYWRRPSGGRLSPSLLDHVVATPGMVTEGTLAVHGYCAALACAPTTDDDPVEYTTVSDHCPVTLDLER